MEAMTVLVIEATVAMKVVMMANKGDSDCHNGVRGCDFKILIMLCGCCD